MIFLATGFGIFLVLAAVRGIMRANATIKAAEFIEGGKQYDPR